MDNATKNPVFHPGDRVRFVGQSSVYGTVVVRPFGTAYEHGVPVLFDGDDVVSFLLAKHLQKTTPASKKLPCLVFIAPGEFPHPYDHPCIMVEVQARYLGDNAARFQDIIVERIREALAE